MAKPIHSMIRVLDEARSVDFYTRAFGLQIADRFGFDGFTLVYLKSPEDDYELELTINHGRTDPYTHGDGYGHIAFVVSDVRQTGTFRSRRPQSRSGEGIPPRRRSDGALFFVTDPDGYRIEILERHGRYR